MIVLLENMIIGERNKMLDMFKKKDKFSKVTICAYCGETAFCKLVDDYYDWCPSLGSYRCEKCKNAHDIESEFIIDINPTKEQLLWRKKRNKILNINKQNENKI